MTTKTPAPRRRRRKKSGKYTPLIWVLTGVLIAFFISYTNTVYKNGGFIRLPSSGTNTQVPPRMGLKSMASNFIKKNPLNIPKNPGTNLTVVTPQAVKVKLFLAKQQEDGVKLVPLEVTLDTGDKPLSHTLEKLLSYNPGGDYVNLIPYNTRIQKISIVNHVAHIHFSSEFEFNSYGRLGYQAQVYQIVYTACQFSTIDAVYFYSGDKPLKYLGGDGTLINNPVYPFSYLPVFN